MALWIPDWPVQAHRLEYDEQDPHPIALIAKHRVTACSAAARADGVRVGIREREAQLRCPNLITLPHDPEVDTRRFAPLLTSIEHWVPGVEPIRPGLVAVRARGPARYYGGEISAAIALHELISGLGFPETRVAIADGRFAAEQATRASSSDAEVTAPSPDTRIVPTDSTARFLAPLPVSRAADAELARTLQSLGIDTLGALAALPEPSVRERFGPAGIRAHRLASGLAETHIDEIRPRTPPEDFSVHIELEPPAAGADHLAFACSALTDRFDERLRTAGLVCTEVRIELTDDTGIRHERHWAHPRHFTGADLIGRLRWQSEALPQHERSSGIARVQITPVHTDRASAHEPGLWNTGPHERVHHHLSRAQGLLGHEGVGTATLTGGRLLTERWRYVPWSTPLSASQKQNRHSSAAQLPRSGPWPGNLVGPLPTVVFAEPLPVALHDANNTPVGIDDDLLTSPPTRFLIAPNSEVPQAIDTAVSAWSRPWPLRERWWRGHATRFRLQVLLADGDAWLLLGQDGTWTAEGRYL